MMSEGRLFLHERRSEHRPVQTSRLKTAGRPFLLLEYRSKELSLFGEAAPLDGYGRDSLSAARDDLSRIRVEDVEEGASILGACWDQGEGVLRAPLWHHLPGAERIGSPAARFCLDMLTARLCAAQKSLSLFQLLQLKDRPTFLPTSEVVNPLSEGEVGRVDLLFQRGVRTFKLKCGRDTTKELAFISRLRERYPVTACEDEGVVLRLDFNCALELETAHAFCASLDPGGIQWLEDPTSHAENWGDLRDYGIPLAADEPLTWEPSACWSKFDTASVLVVKPMALGGIGPCMDAVYHAERANQWICVSHLFDGPCSFEITAALAFAIHSAPGAVGLSEHAGLQKDRSSSLPAVEFSWLRPDRLIVPKSS